MACSVGVHPSIACAAVETHFGPFSVPVARQSATCLELQLESAGGTHCAFFWQATMAYASQAFCRRTIGSSGGPPPPQPVNDVIDVIDIVAANTSQRRFNAFSPDRDRE
jgi:hypothetical protein